MSQPDFQARLKQIQDQFRAGLPSTHHELSQLMAQQNQTADAKTLQQLHAKLHTLVGTSGSLGFSDLSRETRVVEQALRPLLANANGPEWRSTAALLEQLLLLIAKESQQQLKVQTSNKPTSKANKPSGQIAQQASPSKASSPKQWQRHFFELYVLNDQQQLLADLSQQLRHFGYRVEQLSDQEFDQLNAKDPRQRIVFLASDQNRVKEQRTLELGRKYSSNHQTILFCPSDEFRLRLAAVNQGLQGFFALPADTNQVLARLRKFEHSQEERKYRILLIDDDQNLTRFLSEALGYYGFECDSLNQPERILEKLEQFEPDLFLLDYNMPGVKGSEMAAIIRQFHPYSLTPIVLLTADAELVKTEMISLGSDDVLPKGMSPALLAKQLISRLQRAEQLRSLMQLDGLTQLLNHDNIQLVAHQMFSLSQRTQQDCSIAFIDLDHFKRINDRFGHLVGDQVLIGLARLLKHRLRNSDLIGRFGGEEFLLVMPNTKAEQAQKVIEELLHSFQQILFSCAEQQFSCSFSAGINEFGQNSFVQSLKNADQALYRAKDNGRARVEIFRASSMQVHDSVTGVAE